MNINPNFHTGNKYASPSFGHGSPWSESPYNLQEKSIIAATTALGIAGSIAILAKCAKYSLSPSKMFKNFKKSYLYKAPYDEPEIITMGAGSCLGGLAGGYLVDHDKENRKAKLRETLMQISNISVPILFVGRFAKGGKYLGQKFWEKGTRETYRTKLPKAITALAGLFTGVYASNILANKINEKIFHRGKGRPVQFTDFSAHLDDFCMAARQVDENNKVIQKITMCIPIALSIAGNEVGNKTAHGEHLH